MRRLIDDLLSLSRIELNEHIPPSGSCDLSLAVADVADALALLVRERGVSLEVSALPNGDANVVGDRDQILQVIQNLIDNAAKYAGAGGTVRVSVDAGLTLAEAQGAGASPPGWTRLPLLTPDRTDGERFARVRVSDTGPGIAREHLPRLAERFYRVEGQKSGERSGTGLGLAIVKHITNRHRGGLMVESAPGEGAAFSAYFPMAPVAPDTPDAPDAPDAPAAS
jgi:two-component system phosphate regulon sensor histidine kinase PhoR